MSLIVGVVVGAFLGWHLARLVNEPKRSEKFYRTRPHACGGK